MPACTDRGPCSRSGWLEVSGADISVRNELTGGRRQTRTNNSGFYSVASLNPGTYRILIRCSGFETIMRQGVQLEVGVCTSIAGYCVSASVSQATLAAALSNLGTLAQRPGWRTPVIAIGAALQVLIACSIFYFLHKQNSVPSRYVFTRHEVSAETNPGNLSRRFQTDRDKENEDDHPEFDRVWREVPRSARQH